MFHGKRPNTGFVSTIALSVLVLLTGCGETEAGTTARDTSTQDKDNSLGRVPAPAARTAPVASKPLSLTDQLALQSAASACKSADPHAFFDAFVQSEAVRKRYIASVVDYAVTGTGAAQQQKILGSAYDRFPIMMVDHYRKPVHPARAGDQNEYVRIELDQSQTNQISVEWTRVHYDGQSEGGDDLGNSFTLDGAPYDPAAPADGQLIFRPTDDCWELTYDGRDERRAPVR